MKRAEAKGQHAVVVYKKGFKGVRAPGPKGGLGYSQMKEVTFLEGEYPKYAEPGAFKEIDASEFEAENALNRAQIYESATSALIHGKGKAWTSESGEALPTELIERFLRELAYASHTRDGAQFRNFGDDFVAEVTKGLPLAIRHVWTELRPLIKSSKFSLIVWEPTVTGDVYLCAPALKIVSRRPQPNRKAILNRCSNV